ncbi:MAG: hypothetical protein R3E44_08165 [Paracoccaceae bacterium]
MQSRFALLFFLACVAWSGAGLPGFGPIELSGAAYAANETEAVEGAEEEPNAVSDLDGHEQEGEAEPDGTEVEPNRSMDPASDQSATDAGGGQATVVMAPGVHVEFADGHIERVRNGRFERITTQGGVIERRLATAADLSRLRAIAGSQPAPGVRNVAVIDDQHDAIDVLDFRGWRETLADGTYELKDPRGRTVVRRPLTEADLSRVRAALLLD